jgi:RNA polymerase sigma-70 factor (ECF subfamily)
MLQAEDDDELETVINAMSSDLTPDQRHVLILRFVEDFSVRETAEIIKKSVSNTKVIQNRALTKLREILSQKVDVN